MQSITKIEERREMCSRPLCKWIARCTVETVEEDEEGTLTGHTEVLLLCQKHLKEWKRQQHDEKHKEEADCPSTCQYACKVECTCRCKGANHGIKSMKRIDTFFATQEEEEEVVVA